MPNLSYPNSLMARLKSYKIRNTHTSVPSVQGYAARILALLAVTVLAACGNASTATAPSSSPTPTVATLAAVATTPASPIPTAPATLTPTPIISSPTPTTTPPRAVSGETTARQLRVFTSVWETVRDTYVYPDFNGLDWDDVYRRYRAHIEAGIEDEAFYQAMREMIDELGDDHSGYYSPEEVAEEEAELSGQLDYVGIGIYVTTLLDKEYAVLLQVFPDSPAERVGLESHDRILAVEGVPVVDKDGTDHLDRLKGPPGSEVRITVQTPGQEPRELLVRREHIQAQLKVGAFRLTGTQVGYLMIPTFWDNTIGDRVRQALENLMAAGELDGLIVDMRINGGGLDTALEETLSIFTSGELGAFVSRDAPRPLVIEPRPIGNSQELPLVLLVGRETQSFGEIFSGVLQESGRALVVGRTTDGNVEITWSEDFEDGSRLWLARETFRPPSGADWEESGIIPDVEIPLDWDAFTVETDLQLQAALDLVLQTLND